MNLVGRRQDRGWPGLILIIALLLSLAMAIAVSPVAPIPREALATSNPFSWPQCTWYAAGRRPDLPAAGVLGDARQWADEARVHGVPVGTQPVVGSIAVFQPGQYGAGSFGHVAYVESVNGTSMTISESNFGGSEGQIVNGVYEPGDTRTIAWAGLQFIYGGPAGNGPATSPHIYLPVSGGVALRADGRSGYSVDSYGNITAFGGAPSVTSSATWPGWDIVRGIGLRPDGQSGYILDGFGGLHPFGGAPALTNGPYWQGWDIARGIVLDPDGLGGQVLDGFGGIHPFGNTTSLTTSAYWSGWDIARGIALDPDGLGGQVLDGYGGLHRFGNAPSVTSSTYWSGWDIARGVALLGDRVSGYVLDGFGGLHPFGGAPGFSTPVNYHASWDTARGVSAGSCGTHVCAAAYTSGDVPTGTVPSVQSLQG